MRTLLARPRTGAPRTCRACATVVDQMLQGNRNRMLGQEEYWVSGVGTAWHYQTSPLALTTGSFLTQTRTTSSACAGCSKRPPRPDDSRAFVAFLASSRKRQRRPDHARQTGKSLLKALGGDAGAPNGALCRAHLRPPIAFDKLPAGAKQLGEGTPSVTSPPPSVLFLTIRLPPTGPTSAPKMSLDFRQGPQRNPAPPRRAPRKSSLYAGGARLTLVGSGATEAALQPSVRELAGRPEAAARRLPAASLFLPCRKRRHLLLTGSNSGCPNAVVAIRPLSG